MKFSYRGWASEILHQLVDGLSHYNAIIYNVWLPILTNWCRMISYLMIYQLVQDDLPFTNCIMVHHGYQYHNVS